MSQSESVCQECRISVHQKFALSLSLSLGRIDPSNPVNQLDKFIRLNDRYKERMYQIDFFGYLCKLQTECSVNSVQEFCLDAL